MVAVEQDPGVEEVVELTLVWSTFLPRHSRLTMDWAFGPQPQEAPMPLEVRCTLVHRHVVEIAGKKGGTKAKDVDWAALQ